MGTTRYRDLNLSFLMNPISGDVSKYTDVDAIKQSLINLIRLKRGEKPFHPEIASGVIDLLFEPASILTAIRLENEITRVIKTYEPRVILNKVKAGLTRNGSGFQIEINFTVKNIPQLVSMNFSLDRLR